MEAQTIEHWQSELKKNVEANKVYIYAKGEKNMAMCGFSHRVMQIFNHLGTDYEVQNIFADPNIREAVCTFTNWPTIPQVFIDGEFVGGCDIVTEMFQSGELQKKLGVEAPQQG